VLKNFLTSLILITCLNASAMTQGDVTLPDVETVQNHVLTLNGIGFRKATFFKVKVYAAGLYLEKKSKNSDEIINSTGPKKVVMKFLRNVPASDVKSAWDKSFKSLCEAQPCASIEADIKKLKEAMDDVKEGDLMAYTFGPDSIEISLRGEKKAQISTQASRGLLGQLVLKTWIGANPPNSELKEGLLGL
jgi:hypothetical protein